MLRFDSALRAAAAVAVLSLAAPAQVRFAQKSGAHLDGMTSGSPLRTSAFAAGDVDGDNDLDVLVATEDVCLLYLNAGSGEFSVRRNLPVGQRRRISLVDGDGDLDAVCAAGTDAPYNFPGPSALLLNDGQGNFTVAANRLPQVNLTALALGVSDIDGDGDVDIVHFLENTLPIAVWTNDGKGTFADRTATAVQGQSGTARWGRLADVDGGGPARRVLRRSANRAGAPPTRRHFAIGLRPARAVWGGR